MRSLSLRARLTIWCVVVVFAVLAFFAADVLVIQRRVSMRRVDQELEDTRLQLTNMLREELRELDAPKLAAEESCNVIASANRPVAVLTDGGEVLATRFETPSLATILSVGTPPPGIRTIETPSGAWRLQVQRESFDGMALLLVVASPLSGLARDQREMREAILLGLPIALVVAAAGGLWLASIGLRPVAIMARRAGNLPLTGIEDLGPSLRDDEIGQLTRAFNALVARLRAALQTQRQFMADASHELRNPVSVIRSASDVALGREHRDEAEYREALAIANAQSRRLGALVEEMLVLARADAGGYPLHPTLVFVEDVIDECRRAVSGLAADRRVMVTSSGASNVPIRGDRELLQRLVANLLQNAVQHTPAGGTVCVDVRPNGANICIRVIDSGSGIPDADFTRVFDRFVQLDPSRRSEGAGLGLTIAKWIAEAHRGSLVVEQSGPHGTTFCLALPTVSQPV
jgi:two-component system OmpR family sensor kinase